MTRLLRIAFAGGGTGGHLFPAIALAQHHPGASLFLCTTRSFDTWQLTYYGLEHVTIDAPRLREGVLDPLAMPRAVHRAYCALRSFRADVVLGVGGYGSAPTLVAAKLLGIPYALLEQNAKPGRTNRMASKGARRVYGQWDVARAYFGSRYRVTGSPLRRDFRRLTREAARAQWGLNGGLVVGIVGGSQGARSLNDLVLSAWKRLNGVGKDVTLMHLAGSEAPNLARSYAKEGIEARVVEFERDMGAFYSACDLIVSRAGGMAISELASVGVATALVPYPHAAEDHQRENAHALGEAAWIVEDPPSLASLVANLVSGDPAFDNRARQLARFAKPDAASAILGDIPTWL